MIKEEAGRKGKIFSLSTPTEDCSLRRVREEWANDANPLACIGKLVLGDKKHGGGKGRCRGFGEWSESEFSPWARRKSDFALCFCIDSVHRLPPPAQTFFTETLGRQSFQKIFGTQDSSLTDSHSLTLSLSHTLYFLILSVKEILWQKVWPKILDRKKET